MWLIERLDLVGSGFSGFISNAVVSLSAVRPIAKFHSIIDELSAIFIAGGRWNFFELAGILDHGRRSISMGH